MTSSDATERWRHDGVRVIPSDQLDSNTAQTQGMDRKAAVNFARVGAQKLWAGTVHIHPDARTGAHHHGPLESVIFVVKGRARMRWGEALEFVAEAVQATSSMFHPSCRIRRSMQARVTFWNAFWCEVTASRCRKPGNRTRREAANGEWVDPIHRS